MRKSFQKSIVYFTFGNWAKLFWKNDVKAPRGFSKLLSTCQVKIIMKETSLEKITNSILDSRLNTFGFWLNVFDRILKSELYVSKGNFVSKILLKKIEEFAISERRWNFFEFLAHKYRQGCQNFNLRVQRFFFIKIFFQKKIITFSSDFCRYFRKFSRNFFCRLSKHALYVSTWTFWQKFSHYVQTLSQFCLSSTTISAKNDWNLCFHFRTISQSFL